jgi:type I restriction enzyme S subunit
MRAKDIVRVQKGRAPSNIKVGNEIIYLTPEYLRGNSAASYVYDSGNLVEVSESDVLLLWDGSNAGEVFRGKKGALSSTMVKLFFNDKQYHQDYIYYQFKQNESFLRTQTNGSGIPHVDKEILHRIEIAPFLYTTQKKICKILSSIDDCILQTRKIIAKYERIAEGLIQDLLAFGIDCDGNIRRKSTHEFIEKEGNVIPKSWKVNDLNSLCSLIKDGTHLPPKRVDEGIWLLGVANIRDGELILQSSDTKVPENYFNQMHKTWTISPSDVLLAIVGATIGKVTQVPSNFPTFTLQRSVCLLRGKSKILSNTFLRLYMESAIFQKALWAEVNVTAQPGIYLDTIGKLKIVIPTFEEQCKIVDQVAPITKMLSLEKAKLSKFQLLKVGLMQDLLTGELKTSETLINQLVD